MKRLKHDLWVFAILLHKALPLKSYRLIFSHEFAALLLQPGVLHVKVNSLNERVNTYISDLYIYVFSRILFQQ